MSFAKAKQGTGSAMPSTTLTRHSNDSPSALHELRRRSAIDAGTAAVLVGGPAVAAVNPDADVIKVCRSFMAAWNASEAYEGSDEIVETSA